MATFTVTAQDDVVDAKDGKLSLREANATAAADSIEFSRSLEGKKLVLTHNTLTVNDDLRIDEDRNNDGRQVTIDGKGLGPIFNIVGTGTHADLSDPALSGGSGRGDVGGVSDQSAGDSLWLSGANLNHNVGGTYKSGLDWGHGGAIAAGHDSRLTITDSTFKANGGG